MRMRVPTVVVSASTLTAGGRPERSVRQRRIKFLALGALLGGLLAFATAIEYGTAAAPAPAQALPAPDGTAIGHNMAVTYGDGTAMGVGR